MGIDIYARWNGQSADAKRRQSEAWLSIEAGGVGYLREAYHGGPYATKHLCAEAFKTGEARISAATLRARLPMTLTMTEHRERTLYKSSPQEIEGVKQSFRDFVSLCETKERETGEPVLIVASH